MFKINLHPSASLRLTRSAIAVLFCCMIPIGMIYASSLPQTVQIDTGAVSGVPAISTPGVMVFKGIPFAAPPVRDLRWKPPVAPARWTNVLKADHFSSSCMQPIRDGTIPGKSPDPKAPYDTWEFLAHGAISEDCLYLNVWTPAKAGTDELPVMVWIYGGGFNEGSTAVPAYDGERLASHGAVVVTISYRLGVFGFLALPELSKESPHHASGNYGLLDQIAALQWVKRNISAFGGDPKRVTIFGQSAGSGSAHFLSISPLAKGLFQRSIAESGADFFSDPDLVISPMSYKTLSKAEADDLKWAAKSAGAGALKQLRAMSADQLIKAADVPRDPAPFFRPTLDGWVMPASFSEAYAKGMEADVPVIVGSNADEKGAVPHPSITVAEYKDWAQQQVGAMADEFLTLYPATTDEEAGQAKNAAARDWKRTSIYLWAQSRNRTSPVYQYFFDHPPPGPTQEEFGSFHIAEVLYVFSSLAKIDRPFTQKDWELADTISTYWFNFAANGDPNGKGLPTWPTLKPDVKVAMQLGDNPCPIPTASNEKRFDFMQRFFASQQKW